MPAHIQLANAESSDLLEADADLIHSVSDLACWLGCVLVVMSCLASAYLSLSSWPSDGVGLRYAASQEMRLVLPGIDEPSRSIERVPETLKASDLVQVAKLKVGQIFRDLPIVEGPCPHCPEMVVVPAGSFILGSGSGERWREEWQMMSEEPPVSITLTKPFAVGRFAVSFDEWDACVNGGGCRRTPSDQGWGRDSRPAINVSWSEANQYVSWLSGKTGKPYRLLSEAEREYVTRAGTTTAFWFGNSPSPKRANYLWERTMAVNSLAPNAWGLYHVHGNVSEWTADCWNGSHKGHSGFATARQTGNCKRRVVKGGAWFNSPHLLRSAARAGLSSAAHYKTVGLRIARALIDGR